MTSSQRQAGWKIARRAGLLLALALLAVVAAWVIANMVDDPAQPTPIELAMPPPRLPDERNAAYAIEGLTAEGDRDPAKVGRQLWQLGLEPLGVGAVPTPAERDARQRKRVALLGQPIAAPVGPDCARHWADCVRAALDDPASIERERASKAAFGRRCESLVAKGFEFEELLPPNAGVNSQLMSFGALAQCSRWLRLGAALAMAHQDRDGALASASAAIALAAGALDGARSLIGHMVAARLMLETDTTVALLALREPGMAAALAKQLPAVQDLRRQAGRWIPFEAAFHRAGLRQACTSHPQAEASAPEHAADTHEGSMLDRTMDWMRRLQLACLPNRTMQRSDALWIERLGRLSLDWPAALHSASLEPVPHGPSWRNTVGQHLLDLASPQYAWYFARLADLELSRQAAHLVLRLQAEGLAGPAHAQRAVQLLAPWPVHAAQLEMAADGSELRMRGFGDSLPGARIDSRNRIAYRWPP